MVYCPFASCVAFKVAVVVNPKGPLLVATPADPRLLEPEKKFTEPVGGFPKLPVRIFAVSVAPCGAPAEFNAVLVFA